MKRKDIVTQNVPSILTILLTSGEYFKHLPERNNFDTFPLVSFPVDADAEAIVTYANGPNQVLGSIYNDLLQVFAVPG